MALLPAPPRPPIARGWIMTTALLLFVATIGHAVLGVFSGGATRTAALLSAGTFGLALFAVVALLLELRRPRPTVDITGAPTVFEAPALVVRPLLAAWMLLLATAAAWVVVVAQDVTSIDAPVFVFLMIVGALATLPHLVHLLRGRLPRWRVTVDDRGMVLIPSAPPAAAADLVEQQ